MPETSETVESKLERGAYDTKLPYPKDPEDTADPEEREAFFKDRDRLDAEFKSDVLSELQIVGHPKADDLFELAEDLAEDHGLGYVYYLASELSSLIKD
jgi:hypothetical protein